MSLIGIDYGSDSDSSDSNVSNIAVEVKKVEKVDNSATRIIEAPSEINQHSEEASRPDHPHLNKLPPLRASHEANTALNISNFLDDGIDVTEYLRKNKQFSNPCILTKIVTQLNIDEIGSNYPIHIFDPRGFDRSDYEDCIKTRYAAYVAPPIQHIAKGVLSAGINATASSQGMSSEAEATKVTQVKKKSRFST